MVVNKTTSKQKSNKTTSKQKSNKKSHAIPSWYSICGKMRLWARERVANKRTFMSFSTSIGKKDEDDEYQNIYFDVMFKIGKAPDVEEGSFEIYIESGFITLKEYSDGSLHPAVMVMEYEVVDEDEEYDNGDDSDDCPFD